MIFRAFRRAGYSRRLIQTFDVDVRLLSQSRKIAIFRLFIQYKCKEEYIHICSYCLFLRLQLFLTTSTPRFDQRTFYFDQKTVRKTSSEVKNKTKMSILYIKF